MSVPFPRQIMENLLLYADVFPDIGLPKLFQHFSDDILCIHITFEITRLAGSCSIAALAASISFASS